MIYESKDNMPFVSIVVINYNGKHLLDRCLSSVKNSAYSNSEIIMVDNDSEDDSADYVSKKFPSVIVERNAINLGYAGGCNRGAKIAKGDYIVFMNNDVEVSRDWLKALIRVCSKSSVAICGGKILVDEARDRIYSTGGVLNPFSVPIDRAFFEIDNGQFDRLEDVAYVSGAAMMVDRRVFEMLDGFDKNYFAFCEEVDLCLRARALGFQVIYVPSSVVYHIFGASFGKPSPNRRFLGIRNMIFTLFKTLSLKNFLLMLPPLFAFRFFEGIILALSGRTGYLHSFVSAVASAFSNLGSIANKRKKVQEKKRVSDSRILSYFLPVKWLRFLLKKNVFKSIL